MSKVILLSCTEDPELVVATAAKLCYSSFEPETIVGALECDSKGIEKSIRMLKGLGHLSPFEHANFTFAITDVSRSFLAQITRHRIASFSVRSQRYVNMAGADVVVPPALKEDLNWAAVYELACERSNMAYREICTMLIKRYEAAGMSLRDATKKAQEDARFVLPEGTSTAMIVTMNARELLHFFKLRCCRRAQWEIREVADAMLRLVKDKAPIIFEDAGPGCICDGKCGEGPMTCGQPRTREELDGGANVCN